MFGCLARPFSQALEMQLHLPSLAPLVREKLAFIWSQAYASIRWASHVYSLTARCALPPHTASAQHADLTHPRHGAAAKLARTTSLVPRLARRR